MSVEIGLVFRDLTKLPATDAEVKQFLVQSVVPAVMTKLTESSNITRAADPALDQRGVEVSLSWKF